MKKVFRLKEEKRNPERIVEAIKHEIRKYMKRERRKSLPDGTIYWEFDCRFGPDSDQAERINPPELIKALDRAREKDWEECYVEIFSRAVDKKEEEKEEQAEDGET